MEGVEALPIRLLAIPTDAQQATQNDPAEPLRDNAHTKSIGSATATLHNSRPRP